MIKLYLLILLLLYFLSLRVSSFGNKYTKIFPIFHLVAGFVVAGLVYQYSEKIIVIIGLTILVGLLWECYEYILCKVRFLHNLMKRVLGGVEFRLPPWQDALFDLAMDAGGAIMFVYLVIGW